MLKCVELKFTLPIALIRTLVTLKKVTPLIRAFVSILKDVPTMIESLTNYLMEVITMSLEINITAFGGVIRVEGESPSPPML